MSLAEAIAPSIGLCFTFTLFSSSLPGSWQARKTGVLPQDPTPSVTTLINTILWVIYSAMKGDPWIFVGNFYGIMSNSFNTIIAMRYAKEEARLRIDLIFCIGLTFLGFVIFFLGSDIIVDDEDLRLSVVSKLCIGLCLVMFASPLIQGIEALRCNDGSKINILLSCAQFGNGCMWTSYGFGQGDMTVILPNGISIFLAAANLLIKLIIRLRTRGNGKSVLAIPAATTKTTNEALLSPAALLDAAIAHGTPVQIRSLWFSDRFMHVDEGDAASTNADSQDADLESQTSFSYVRGVPAAASAIQLVSLGEGEVGLRIPDGRFLELQTTTTCHEGRSQVQPSEAVVVAVQCERPSAAGRFSIVFAPAKEQDASPGKMLVQRDFQQDSVSFYNKSLGLFLRCNEKGFFDSSPRWGNDMSSEGWRLPVGWLWERFAVEAYPEVVSSSPPAPASGTLVVEGTPAAVVDVEEVTLSL